MMAARSMSGAAVAARRPMPWRSILVALATFAACLGVVGWWLNLQALDRRMHDELAALKKSLLKGHVPPDEELLQYLSARLQLEQRYQDRLKMAAVNPSIATAGTDPQLYFQEQLHEAQRTMERLAAARGVPVPEQLGFPKELPPSETVPRLLVQLSLMQETAALILEQGVTAAVALKVEDPQALPDEAGGGPFLQRVPIRVKLSCTVAQLTRLLGAMQQMRPMADVPGLRIASAAPPDHPEQLDVELLVARYMVLAAAPSLSTDDAASATKPHTLSGRAAKRASSPRPARSP